MTSSLVFSGAGICLVCNKVIYGNAVNIYSGLTKRNGTIYDQISEVVSVKDFTEARDASDVVCVVCLKLLLSINNVESELKNLKIEFMNVFQSGVQSRKAKSGRKCEPIRRDIEIKSECEENTTSLAFHANNKNFSTYLLKPGKKCVYDENIVVDSIKETFPNDHSLLSERESICLEENIQDDMIRTNSCDFIQVTQEIDNEPPKVFSDPLHFVHESPKHEIKCDALDSDDKRSMRSKESSTSNGNSNEVSTSLGGAEDDLDGRASVDFENFEKRLCSTDADKETLKETDDRAPKKPRQISNNIGKSSKRKKTLKSRKASSLDIIDRGLDWSGDGKDHHECKQDENGRKSRELCRDRFCKICNKEFVSSTELSEHRKMHEDIYKYVCDKCPNARYKHKSKLTQHFKLRHKVHVHQCPGCDIEEASQNSLDQHIINKHPESRFFECKFCCKAFRTHRYLHFVHIKRCHIGLPIKYFCDKCPKGFVDKSSLDNHKYTHSDVKNFSCKFCGATFLTPYSLKVHVNIHTHEKKYTCQTCGTSFLRLCNLIGHKKNAHQSRDKRYVCEICGKLLHTNKDLVKHQNTCHKDGKSIACDKCGKNFTNRRNLKIHLIEHLKDKPFKCHCGKAYMNRSRLQHHCKVVHNMELTQNIVVNNEVVEENTKDNNENNEEENMVVITVKECSSHTLYTVQNAPSQDIFISSEIPVSHVDTSALTKNLTTTESVELPLLQSAFETYGTERLSLSAPLLFTSLTTSPSVAVHQPQETVAQLSSGVHDDFSYQSDSVTTVVNSEDQDPLQVLQNTTQESQTADPLAAELLELPSIHTGNPNEVPVTYITAWP